MEASPAAARRSARAPRASAAQPYARTWRGAALHAAGLERRREAGAGRLGAALPSACSASQLAPWCCSLPPPPAPTRSAAALADAASAREATTARAPRHKTRLRHALARAAPHTKTYTRHARAAVPPSLRAFLFAERRSAHASCAQGAVARCTPARLDWHARSATVECGERKASEIRRSSMVQVQAASLLCRRLLLSEMQLSQVRF